jgi:hypothetical protein
MVLSVTYSLSSEHLKYAKKREREERKEKEILRHSALQERDIMDFIYVFALGIISEHIKE